MYSSTPLCALASPMPVSTPVVRGQCGRALTTCLFLARSRQFVSMTTPEQTHSQAHDCCYRGSDHPALLEAFARRKKEGLKSLQIITCPNEMVGLSAAQGYAQTTGLPAAVIVHVVRRTVARIPSERLLNTSFSAGLWNAGECWIVCLLNDLMRLATSQRRLPVLFTTSPRAGRRCSSMQA